uniref:Uncharacterized protein n=1 Tax=Picea sitchensis TaxID=3332 RepID=D5AD07_PICSI|nr:unknown [Picea sitchensis]
MDLNGEHNSFEMKYGSLFYGPVASVCMISGRKISSSSSARATTPISSILARATTPISSIYFASENRLTFTGWFSGVWSARSGSGQKKTFDGAPLYSPVFPSNLTDVCAFPICSFYKGKE